RAIGDNFLQIIAVTIDRNYCREVLDLEFPYGFRTTELFEPDAENALHALGVDLSRSPDAVQINAALFLACLLSFRPHTALTDDAFDAEAFDDFSLVRFFADRSRWACRDNPVLATISENDRTTMVDHSVSNDFQFPAVVQVLVNCIPARENDAIEQDDVS